MNFCKDCLWFTSSNNRECFCNHPKAEAYGPVMGERIWTSCAEMREYISPVNKCGVDGRWFEPVIKKDT